MWELKGGVARAEFSTDVTLPPLGAAPLLRAGIPDVGVTASVLGCWTIFEGDLDGVGRLAGAAKKGGAWGMWVSWHTEVKGILSHTVAVPGTGTAALRTGIAVPGTERGTLGTPGTGTRSQGRQRVLRDLKLPSDGGIRNSSSCGGCSSSSCRSSSSGSCRSNC